MHLPQVHRSDVLGIGIEHQFAGDSFVTFQIVQGIADAAAIQPGAADRSQQDVHGVEGHRGEQVGPGVVGCVLDHHIKCGNAIVGFVHREDVDKGVPEEAFVTLTTDDKTVAAAWRADNKAQRESHRAGQQALPAEVQQHLDVILAQWKQLSGLPERTPTEIERKKAEFVALAQSQDAWILNQIAAIPIAQFYIPKTAENNRHLIADGEFRRYWTGALAPQGHAVATASDTALRKRFFQWFLELPEISARGGFDCILGNPPYLGGQALSGTYGHAFCGYVKWAFAPAGLSDLVVYFVRRIFALLKPDGFAAFITTNSIKDGDVRKDGLEQVLAQGGTINMAVRGIKWPGRAKLVVSLVAIHKGAWIGLRVLDGREVQTISAYFEDSIDASNPIALRANQDRIYQGAIYLGDGFLLTPEQASDLRRQDPRNADVVFPAPRGKEDINSRPDQEPGRWIINFHNWTVEKSSTYEVPFHIIEGLVRPVREKSNRPVRRDRWWQYAERAVGLHNAISNLSRCFAAARTTKFLNFSAMPTNYVFTDSLYVFTIGRWDLYTVVQSTLHEVWARKYSGALKQDLRYSPSDCFETFAFPEGLWETAMPPLADIGERYHEHRKGLMLLLWLGLTDVYNLFHVRDLSVALIATVSSKPTDEAERGLQGLLELRRLHRELDHALRDAYGWTDLELGHDFHEVETLPEDDRVRYTISPAARKEILRRLLALNQERAVGEAAQKAPAKKKRGRKTAELAVDMLLD